MKLKYELEIINMDGEQMAVPIDSSDVFRGILRMNETTAKILKLLKTDTTEDAVVSALQKEYDATKEQLRHSVKKVIDILSSEGLLSE